MVSAALVVEADARGWILPASASPLEFLADDPLLARVLACSRARVLVGPAPNCLAGITSSKSKYSMG